MPPPRRCRRPTRCAPAAPRRPGPVPGMAGLIPALLDGLDADRRGAVTSVARPWSSTLRDLRVGARPDWPWELLDDVDPHPSSRRVRRLVGEVAQALRARRAPGVGARSRRPRAACPTRRSRCCAASWTSSTAAGGPVPCCRHPRSASGQPVRRDQRWRARPGDRRRRPAADSTTWHCAERMRRIATECAQLGVPAPHGPADLPSLADVLGRVGAAARSVGALRHDVLFLAPTRPVAVPDVETAAGWRRPSSTTPSTVHPPRRRTGWRPTADELADLSPVDATAPEHADAVAALRTHDADGYAVGPRRPGRGPPRAPRRGAAGCAPARPPP